MINSVLLVGRIVETPVLKNYEDGSYAVIRLAVNRPFRNSDGDYDTDFIRCVVWNSMATSTCDYCRKGDIVGIRGRLVQKHSDVSFDYNGEILKKSISTLEVVGERVVFIMTSGQKQVDNINIDEEIS